MKNVFYIKAYKDGGEWRTNPAMHQSADSPVSSHFSGLHPRGDDEHSRWGEQLEMEGQNNFNFSSYVKPLSFPCVVVMSVEHPTLGTWVARFIFLQRMRHAKLKLFDFKRMVKTERIKCDVFSEQGCSANISPVNNGWHRLSIHNDTEPQRTNLAVNEQKFDNATWK
jgi:hypothetical protein